MSKSADLTKQLRYQNWIEEVKACEARPEGMSVKRWCREYGIKEPTYYGHLHKVKEYVLDAASNPMPVNALMASDSQPPTPVFVELPVSKPAEKSRHSVILTFGKATVEVSEEISDGFLIRLFKAASHA